MSSRIFAGQCASAGFAEGPVHVARSAPAGAVRHAPHQCDADSERARLAGAVETALAAIAALMAQQVGEAAEILEFQTAMLADEALTEPAFAAISQGASAGEAWSGSMAAMIGDYEAAEDDYFRARASDLADIRDAVLQALHGGGEADLPPGCGIYLAEDLTPSRFLSLDWTGKGIALIKGSATSHVAMLARSRQIPMVVNLGEVPARQGEAALLDAAAAHLILDPDTAERRDFADAEQAFRAVRTEKDLDALRPAVTGDGEAVSVLINIADPSELVDLDPAICDGIGLVRTELMFSGRGNLPDEEEQFAAYRTILDWAGNRPVIIRSLDAGGDKPIPGYTLDGETNPFLGLRGVRLSLRRPDVFRQQIRALLRAAPFGALKVMAPMVSTPDEMRAVRGLFESEADDLARNALPYKIPDLGMMVEVPAAAYLFDRFNVDFGSIGSNDLAQYIMAAGRDSAEVSNLARTDDPAVLHAIAAAVEGAKRRGVSLSLCGDAASDPALVPALLGTGLRALSCAPRAVGAVKRAIGAYRGIEA